MSNVNVKINGRNYSVPADATILEAARAASIDIPTLCYMKEINAIGACRMCLVEIKGARAMAAACVQPVTDGMEVQTNTPALRAARKANLQLLLSDHNKDCLSCVRNTKCELQQMCADYGVDDEDYYKGSKNKYEKDTSTPYLVRDNEKCINCRRCVAACAVRQETGVIGTLDRGFDTHIGCAFDAPLADVPCTACGQCIVACPTGALHEKDDTAHIWEALADPETHVVICAAPSIRVTIGECFGLKPGTFAEGKMAAACKRLGFDGVYDMDFTADLTIMEEANEFIERVQKGGKLPLITSCSPGWIRFCEYYYPEFIDNLSSCKSPQQMFGAMYKTYFAKKLGLDPKKIFVVSAIPCTAKKFEVTRGGESAAGEGIRDVDAAITTRELARMIERAGIRFNDLPDEPFDKLIDTGSGAGVIFGTTGGVMEAALRTAAETILGKSLEKLDFLEVRGLKGIRTASYKLGDMTVKVAVASGTADARKLLEMVKSGELDVQFIEIMGCPGGCINGGGQPVQPMSERNFFDFTAARAKAIYERDSAMELRKSHENPIVKQVYKEFLEKPGSHKAHELLHTHYVKREKYVKN